MVCAPACKTSEMRDMPFRSTGWGAVKRPSTAKATNPGGVALPGESVRTMVVNARLTPYSGAAPGWRFNTGVEMAVGKGALLAAGASAAQIALENSR